MSVTITQIQPSDAIASSRLTLNSNFSALQAGINAVQLLLDPTAAVLQGVKSATINDNSQSFNTSIFIVGKGSSLLGNVIMGTTGASTSVLVNGNGGVSFTNSSLTLGTGNLSLSSSSSVASFAGNVVVSNELDLPGVATAFSGVVSLTGPTTIATVAGLKYLVLSNNSTVSGVTASFPAGSSGQALNVFQLLGASGYPLLINTTNFYGLTGSIQMTNTGDTFTAVYDGGKWYLWNYSPASFAQGGTASSITFQY